VNRWPQELSEELDEIVSNDWCWQWPGWNWVANTLNARMGTKYSASACRTKYIRMCAHWRKNNCLGEVSPRSVEAEQAERKVKK